MSNPQKNLNPILIQLFESFNPMREDKKAPAIAQAMASFIEIYNIDLNCDWEVYNDFFFAYMRRAGILILPNCTEEVISDYFNVKGLSESRIKEFLQTYTYTYFVEPDNSIDMNDLNEKNYYDAGI
jgi:hypothetical protein